MYHNFSITGGVPYKSNFYAGESFGSSRMTNSLHQMVNVALERYTQRLVMQVIAELLQNILNPDSATEAPQTKEPEENKDEDNDK